MVINNNKCLKIGLRKNQRKWTKKLEQVDLAELTRVCTFAKGSYAHVTLVQLPGEADSAFALKTMQKAQFKKRSARKLVMAEKTILTKIESDFVVKLYQTYKDKKYLHLLTEYCPGGTLSGRGKLSENAAKFYCACIVEALDSLHSANVVHNDLKPDNLVLDAEGYLKVIDLGFATKIEPGEFAYHLNGTSEYLPPEVISSKLNRDEAPYGRDRAVDLWALGVILFKFLSGSSPFAPDDGDKIRTRRNTMKGMDWAIVSSRHYFSTKAEDLIRKLCCYQWCGRLGYKSIDEIRRHRWFKKFDWDGLRKRSLKPPMVPEVVSAIDTDNFASGFKVTPDSEVQEDDSDWDAEF